ncbi:hypothetical protein EDB86DRAFT_2928760 [Lactarius hatsudake]|nr:hypothetical protein EDB86DRAFT_2928760 [Lactarius hatsudake]
MSRWGLQLMARRNQNLGDLSFPVVGWQRRSLRAIQTFFCAQRRTWTSTFPAIKVARDWSIELADPGRDVTCTTADRREHCLGNLPFNAERTKYDTARPCSSCSIPLPPTALSTADQQSKATFLSMSLNDISATFTHSYAQVFAISVLYYDHLLTFPAEVSHVWSQPISINTLLFLLNRYVAFLGNVAVPLVGFSGLISLTSCTPATYVRQGLLVLSQVLVSVTLAIRIIALYHSTRRIILWVVGSGTILTGVTFWSLVGQHATFVPDAPGCYYLISETTGIHLAFAWEAQAIFDALVFALTVMRTLKMRKLHNMAISLSGVGLLDVLLRDGALYFAVMALANLANIFTFYFSRPALKGFLSTPASCVSVTLCSRLVLHLYEVATPASSIAESSPDLVSAVNLTSRIELGMITDDRSELESVGSSR